jgi:hypothetical protein
MTEKAAIEELVQAVRRMRGYQRAYLLAAPRSPERVQLLESTKGAERVVDRMLDSIPKDDCAPSLKRTLAMLATDPDVGARVRELTK